MSQEKIIFIEALQKYIYLNQLDLLEPEVFYRPVFFNSKILEKSANTYDRVNNIDLISIAAEKSEKMSLQDKDDVKNLLEQMKDIHIVNIGFTDNLTRTSDEFLDSNLVTSIEQIDTKISLFNNLNKQLKNKLKTFFSGEALFYYRESDISYHPPKERFIAIPLEDLLIKNYTLNKKQKENLQYVKNNYNDIASCAMTLQEYNAQTEQSFVIYSKGRESEGFYNSKEFYGSFNNAQTFRDIKKAQRTCRGNHLKSYQIWKISSQFVEKMLEVDCSEGPLLNGIIAQQEKLFLEESMKLQEVVEMKNTIEFYEQVLKEHNLTTYIKTKNQEKKKTNKL